MKGKEKNCCQPEAVIESIFCGDYAYIHCSLFPDSVVCQHLKINFKIQLRFLNKNIELENLPAFDIVRVRVTVLMLQKT